MGKEKRINMCDLHNTVLFVQLNVHNGGLHERRYKKIQSDIHLYEDYINSIQYLEEFDEIFPAKKLGTLTQNIIDNLKETH